MSQRTTSRDELDRIKRDVDLVAYAQRFKFYVDHQESSPRGNPVNWILRRDSDDEKLVARRKDQGWVYKSLRDPENYGTVIDFAQRELCLSKGRGTPGFGLAVRDLRSFLGEPSLRSPAAAPPQPAQAPDRATIQAEFQAAMPIATPRYLVEQRHLDARVLRDGRFTGCWRVDQRGNVLFPHHDEAGLCGYEAKNRGFTNFRGTKGLWQSRSTGADQRLVFAEAPIDALSYHQLNPDPATCYVSSCGNMGKHQEELLVAAIAELAPSATIVLAVDADRGGDGFVLRLNELVGGRRVGEHRPPTTKDWNAYLQRFLNTRDPSR